EQARQQAAQTLKKAGEQVSDTAQQLPEPAGGEWDPLIPDSENPSQTDSDTYEDSDALPSSSQQESSPESADSAESGEMVTENGAPTEAQGDQLMENGSPPRGDGDTSMESEAGAQADGELSSTEGGRPGGEYPEELAEDIRAAQEALEQAGIAIQAAGVALETAETDAELAEAEKLLARARVSVIIAGQDLVDISDIFEDTPQERTILDAEEALNEANVAIVIATDSIFDSRIQLPDFGALKGEEDKASSGSGSGQSGDQSVVEAQGSYPGVSDGSGGSELDKALDDSIAIFEGRILDARNQVLGSTPPPTSAENVPGVAVLGGKGLEQGTGTFEENTNERLEPGIPDVIERGRMPEGSELTKTGIESTPPPVPEDVPSPQGDDIVAQQLREAAAAETDPDLRAKLWDEYKKYKTGL
ncbi:MAG: hypothetical protein HOJ11_06380, partial [Gammaproteobacteria bacterium]|nr:hypothetical protein [Gammaproteobacteria bacterium]